MSSVKEIVLFKQVCSVSIRSVVLYTKDDDHLWLLESEERHHDYNTKELLYTLNGRHSGKQVTDCVL